MSVNTIHVLHGLRLPSGAFLDQITNGRITPGMDNLIGMASGHPYPMFTGAKGLKPEASGRTTAIETLLASTGLTGLDTSAGNTDLYFKKATDLGVRVANATTSHLRFRATQGLLYCQRITARHQQNAEAEFRYLPTWDGSANPLVAAGGVALAGSSSGQEFFTLGPIKLNGSWVNGIDEVTYDFGITLFEIGTDGEPYLTFAGIKELSEVAVTIKTLEATSWTTYAPEGLALTDFVGFLRKKDPDGINEANGASEHYKFTNAIGGRIIVENSEGGGNEPVSNQCRVLLRCATDSQVPLTLAANQTIA